MKQFLKVRFLLLCITFGLLITLYDSLGVEKITAQELKKKLDSNQVLLIDVREPVESRSEYIDGSHLIPLDQVSQEKLPPSSLPIVIHCSSGKRSEEAAKKLLAQNPNLQIYSLEDGIAGWKNTGYAIKSLGSNVLSLDRQTQIAAGFIAFSGVILGTFVHPAFYILPGFVGTGLMFAGFTGWCGMAKVLAKMPWNQ